MYYYCARCQGPLVPDSRMCERCGEVFDIPVPPPPQTVDPAIRRAVQNWPPGSTSMGALRGWRKAMDALGTVPISARIIIAIIAVFLVVSLAVTNFRARLAASSLPASGIAIAADPRVEPRAMSQPASSIQRVAGAPPVIAPPPVWDSQQNSTGEQSQQDWSSQPVPSDSSVPSFSAPPPDPETPEQQQAMEAYMNAWQDASVTNSNLGSELNIESSGAAPEGTFMPQITSGLMEMNDDLATMQQAYPYLSPSDQEQVDSNRLEAQVRGDVAIWSEKFKEKQNAQFGGP